VSLTGTHLDGFNTPADGGWTDASGAGDCEFGHVIVTDVGGAGGRSAGR